MSVREVEERERDKGFNLKKNKQNDSKNSISSFVLLFFLIFTGGRIRAVLGDDLILPAIFSVSNRTQTFFFCLVILSLMIYKFKLG